MTLHTSRLTFITPAFLAGANQNTPEIRAASIRGQLRWWFRVLGGTPDQERQAFGGVHGDAPCTSKVVVRVSAVAPKVASSLSFSPMSDFGYLYYFAEASGKKEGIHRTLQGSYFAPGTQFTLTVTERMPLGPRERLLVGNAVQCLIRLGCLGLRSSRGCGAMAEEPPQDREDFADWTRTLPRDIIVRCATDSVYRDWKSCQEALGGFLREFRKSNRLTGKAPSALGFSDGKARESSALRLRPVQVTEGYIPVVLYTDAACAQPSVAALVSSLKFRV
jgi:CRISPR type III-B/RAMP module RAMP protein Cmr1